MDADESPEFLRSLALTAEVFRETLPAHVQEEYFDLLKDLSLPAALAALREARGSLKWFPKPVELRKLARDHLQRPRIDRMPAALPEYLSPEQHAANRSFIRGLIEDLMQKFSGSSKAGA